MSKIIPSKNGSKKQVITGKATRLFKEKGFPATSMRHIAEAMGIEAPSLYNHIRSKGEILSDICFTVAKEFMHHIKIVEQGEEPVINKMEMIIRFHIKMMIEKYESVYVSDHEWKHLKEPELTEFKILRRNYRKRFAEIAQEGIKNKELKSIDAYVMILTIFSAIGGIENWQRSKKNIDAAILEENMVSVLIDGIRR
ncbi:TetR/AcrR family transcriptional regulator [soil metagenome]